MDDEPRSYSTREVVFEHAVMTLSLAVWRGGAGWILAMAEAGQPLNLPPDPCPFPRLSIFRRPR
jgi:hypothetical protein